MPFGEAAKLIHFAGELHQIDKLSQKIQRDLSENRAGEISQYLLSNEDRFFNSLVVAIYKGDPRWHAVGKLRPETEEAKELNVPDYTEESIGLLSITRNERLFALDGQHRLAGIKKAVDENPNIAQDHINVIIVVHQDSPEGLVKSRRLFTTLNKKAQLVSKDAIIALDEDDISACITRKLIESDEFRFFNEENISFSSGPVRDQSSITSIVNLYDNIRKISAHFLKVDSKQLDLYRLQQHPEVLGFVRDFFFLTIRHCPELTKVAVEKHSLPQFRNRDDGGHLLFRPVGWDLYTDLILDALNNNHPLEDAIENVLSHDLYLNGPILSNKIWSLKMRRIIRVSSKSYREIRRALFKNF